MKKIILLALLLLALLLLAVTSICAQTKTEKAKTTIRKELKNRIGDYNSYSPISYSKLDSLFSSIEDFPPYELTLQYLIEACEKITFTKEISLTTDVKPLIEKLESELKSSGSSELRKILLQLMEFDLWQGKLYESIELFKPEFIGYKIAHSYRAKNKYGGTEIYNYEFHLDKDITKVIKVIPIEKNK